MGLVSLGGGYLFWPDRTLDQVPSENSVTLDAAGEFASWVFQVPKTGTISKLWFRVGNSTTGATLELDLVTVSVTDGFPTGTAYGSSAQGTVVVNTDDNTDYIATLGTGGTATRGDIVAFKLTNPTVSPGNLQIDYGTNAQLGFNNFPYLVENTGSNNKDAGSMLMAVGYDDGSWESTTNSAVYGPFSATAFDNADNPNHRGVKFTLPFPCSVAGIWAGWEADGDCKFEIWEDSGANSALVAGATVTVDNDQTETAQNEERGQFLFLASVELSKDTTYRLLMIPQHASQTVGYRYWTVTDSAVFGALPGGTNWAWTEAQNPSLVSDFTDTANKRWWSGLIIDKIHDGAGGGAGTTIIQRPRRIM